MSSSNRRYKRKCGAKDIQKSIITNQQQNRNCMLIQIQTSNNNNNNN